MEWYFLVKLPAINSNNHTHTNNLTALHISLSGKTLQDSIFLTYPEQRSTQMPISMQSSDFIKMCKLQLLLGKQPAEQQVYLVQDKKHLCFSSASETITPLYLCIQESIFFLLVNQQNTQLAQLQTLQNCLVPGNTYILLLMVSLCSLLAHLLKKKNLSTTPRWNLHYFGF